MKKSGTFMYHPHADEMVQMAHGHDGLPRRASEGPEVHAGRPRLRLPAQRLRHRAGRRDAEGQHHARLQPVDVEHARISRHRPLRLPHRRPRADPLRQSDHDQPSDPHARLRLRGDLHRRRLGAEVGALAGSDDRRGGRPDARLRVRRDLPGRLGDPLPQVAPHDERHGPRRADDDRRRSSRGRQADPEAGARLHGDGRTRHGRHGRDGDAVARTTRCR